MITLKRPDLRQRSLRWIRAEGWIAVVAAIAWLVRYVSRYGIRLGSPPWAAYFDQAHYLRSAQAFFHANLTADQHWYPLLYPLLASPFVAIAPADPFLPLDVILFAATITAFVRVAKHLDVSAVVSTVAALAACLIHVRTAKAWLDPWTTTLSAALIWWTIERTIALALPIAGSELPAPRKFLILGLLAGALPLARPTDALVSGICLVITFVVLATRDGLRWQQLAHVAAGLAVAIVPYLALHVAIYGPHETPYMATVSQYGFIFDDLPWKAYTLLISARPWYPDTKSVIEMLPWLVPSAAGVFTLLSRRSDRRATTLVILAVAVPYCVLFLAFGDLLPTGMWHFGNFHYFKWTLPLAGLGLWSWLTCLRTPRRAAIAVVAVVLVLAPTCIRVLPRRVSDAEPARMLRFDGSTSRNWEEAYFAPATIVDSRGRMTNVVDFHQIPDDRGARAIAIRRLFEGPALRSDPQDAGGRSSREAPSARYDAALSLGLPCWAKPKACAAPIERSGPLPH